MPFAGSGHAHAQPRDGGHGGSQRSQLQAKMKGHHKGQNCTVRVKIITGSLVILENPFLTNSLRLLNALNSEDRGLKARFSLATIVFETFELILCPMLSSQGKKRTFKPLSSLFSAFSNLKVSEDFWVFLSFISDRSVFSPSGQCAENAEIARKREENPEILAN